MILIDADAGTRIVLKAREYLGTPFVHQGRQKMVGVDCIGLPVCTLIELQLPYCDEKGYSRRPSSGMLLKAISSVCEQIPLDDRRPGDFLMFQFLGIAWPQHLAICSDKGMIHTHMQIGRVVEHSINEAWLEKLHSVWRLRLDPLVSWQP